MGLAVSIPAYKCPAEWPHAIKGEKLHNATPGWSKDLYFAISATYYKCVVEMAKETSNVMADWPGHILLY